MGTKKNSASTAGRSFLTRAAVPTQAISTRRSGVRRVAVAAFALAAGTAASLADTAPGDSRQTDLASQIEFFPFAVLLVSDDTVSLPFPLLGSPVLPASLEFLIFGNVDATLTATPNAVMQVDGRQIGMAVNGSGAVGYDVSVHFGTEGKHLTKRLPDMLAARPGVRNSVFADSKRDLTALPADMLGRMLRRGTIQVATDSGWTEQGELPLPGTYIGQITLTLTPDY